MNLLRIWGVCVASAVVSAFLVTSVGLWAAAMFVAAVFVIGYRLAS